MAREQRYIQAYTHRRSRRVARTWKHTKDGHAGLAETGSNLSDGTLKRSVEDFSGQSARNFRRRGGPHAHLAAG